MGDDMNKMSRFMTNQTAREVWNWAVEKTQKERLIRRGYNSIFEEYGRDNRHYRRLKESMEKRNAKKI